MKELKDLNQYFNQNTDEPTILDSGERTEFSSGAVRDMHAGKGRFDLMPWAALMEVSKHCEAGAMSIRVFLPIPCAIRPLDTLLSILTAGLTSLT